MIVITCGQEAKLARKSGKNSDPGFGEMDPSVKCLFCKHEDLSSKSRTHAKKAGMMECPCNPTTGEVETGGSLELAGQPS